MTKFRAGTSGKIIPAATSANDGYATAAQIAKLDSISDLTVNSVPVDEIQFPVETVSVSNGIAVNNGRFQRYLKTELDHLLLGEQGSSNYTRTLLKEATVICPLLGRDRYWDTTDSLWKSRNYGTLGGGLILGSATESNSQLPYTSGRKGCRLLAGTGVGMIQIPYAWLDPDGAFTVLIRYQRPCGVGLNYSGLLQIGDTGGGSGSGRFYARTGTVDELQSSVGLFEVPASSYSPRVLCVSAAAGAGAQLKIFTDGALKRTGVKAAGVLTLKNHAIGGIWLAGNPYGYAHWNILDVVVIPRQLTDSEVAWLTRTVQYPDSPVVDLLSGQSNMVGPGNIGNGEVFVMPTPVPNAGVLFTDESCNAYWNDGFGPCDIQPGGGFGPELSICAALPGRRFIKYGRSGTSSSGWIGVTGVALDIADGLMGAFAQLNCKPVVKNFVFRQGETDAEIAPGTMTPAYRAAQLTSVIGQVRLGLNQSAPSLRAVIARVPLAIATYPSIVSLDNVRAGDALFVSSDPNAVLVDIDACPVRVNDLHNTNQGVLDVGTLCAAQMQL